VFGANEKWVVLPAPSQPRGGRRTGEEVRAGEEVMLRSARGVHLCIGPGDGVPAARGGGQDLEAAGVCADAASAAAVWHLLLPNCPLVPAWREVRPFQTDGYLAEGASAAPETESGAGDAAAAAAAAPAVRMPAVSPPPAARRPPPAAPTRRRAEAQAALPPLSRLPSSLQEHALLEDLLGVVLGFPGAYVHYVAGEGGAVGSFVLARRGPARGADPSLALLLARMLPLGSHVLHLQRFVRQRSRPEHGRVAHALAAAVRTLLDEFAVVVAQLESLQRERRLSLQRAWYYLQVRPVHRGGARQAPLTDSPLSPRCARWRRCAGRPRPARAASAAPCSMPWVAWAGPAPTRRRASCWVTCGRRRGGPIGEWWGAGC